MISSNNSIIPIISPFNLHKKMKKGVSVSEEIPVSVIWRGEKKHVKINKDCNVRELGTQLQNLTKVSEDTMRLLVPRSKISSISPFSDKHATLTLPEVGITEGQTIRMMGVFSSEIEEVRRIPTKAELTIAGFEEEERRAKRLSGGYHVPRKLPQGPYIFGDFRTLHIPGIKLYPPAEQALSMMHKLASDPGIVAIMNKHCWRVGIMTELAPVGYVGVSPKCLLGFNKNHGEEISLRLRTDDLQGFRKYESIKKTLLHELAHMVHSEHDEHFYALDKQLNQEAISLDWTKSRGHTLTGSRHDRVEEEFFEANESYSSQKLGGNSLRSLADARAAAAAAAISRYITPPSTEISMEAVDEHDIPLRFNGCDNVLSKENEPDPDDCLMLTKDEPDPDDCLIENEEPDPDDHSMGVKYEPDPDDCLEERELESDLDEKMLSDTNHHSYQTQGHNIEDNLENCQHHVSSAKADVQHRLQEGTHNYVLARDEQLDANYTTVVDPSRPKEEPDPDDGNEFGNGSPNGMVQRVDDYEGKSKATFSSSVSSNPSQAPQSFSYNDTLENHSDMAVDSSNGIVNLDLNDADGSLKRIQESSVTACTSFNDLIQKLKYQAPPIEFASVVRTLSSILRNVIDNPNEEKFKRLRKANPIFQRLIAKYEAAIEVLLAVGFVEDYISSETGNSEAYLVLKRKDAALLWLARSSLEICAS